MISIYIDDSGNKGLTDTAQPIYLLSAVFINNEVVNNIKSEIRQLIDMTEDEIRDLFHSALGSKSYTPERAMQVTQMIMEKLTMKSKNEKSFELHGSELLRGDNIFMMLEHEKRVEIMEKSLEIIALNDLKVVTIACDKQNYKNKFESTISKKDIETQMEVDMCEHLINLIEKYLVLQDEQASIIADKGNCTIKEQLIPRVREKASARLSTEIFETPSHLNEAIQLADICAYTNNIKLRSEKYRNFKHRNEAERLYAIIDDSNDRLMIDEMHEIDLNNAM